MSSEVSSNTSDLDYEILSAVRDVGTQYPALDDGPLLPQQEGWVTSSRVREQIGAKSLETRKGLQHLVVEKMLQSSRLGGVEVFRLSGLGARALEVWEDEHQRLGEAIRVSSSDWTGLVSPIQIKQVLSIVSQIEDCAEAIRENEVRSQILGLALAIKTLLDLPQPPRQGLVELIRDPAFANIVQIGTFLAAITAALRA
ncbi:hypothetical protein GRI38_04145 [Altererythrobacter aurantiacus]|uniref:Uncharacterized protein n=1 Tax=Parapontixanthobacter aurantiacus TaxID=1463599 RepID=A0A844ZCE9_9SPHN|nr:hypothetical protein [Parapontixanthobacter aurantiacus]MXO85214.1 hypothetical protein [Parapontixanthobacter aurantiacus]